MSDFLFKISSAYWKQRWDDREWVPLWKWGDVTSRILLKDKILRFPVCLEVLFLYDSMKGGGGEMFFT